MKPSLTRSRMLWHALLFSSALAPAFAQATSQNDDSEVVLLGEFNVSATTNNDYLAAESITGTRVASKLQDLPFAVNVVTGEFINDFAAYELWDQLGYVSSIAPNEVQGAYQIRGFESSNQLRNGFRRLGLIDKVSVDRTEVIKGPAASIYGKIQPGGVVNIVTRKPRTKTQHTASLAVGSDNFWRAQASSTGPVGNSSRVFYRVDMAADDRDYAMNFKEKDQQTVAAQLMWKLDSVSALSFEIEYLARHERRGNGVAPVWVTGVLDPYRTGNRTYSRYQRLAVDELFDFNHQGPNEYNDRDVFTLTGTYERRLNSVWSMRLGANWFDRGFDRMWISGDRFNPATRTIISRTPVWRPIDEGGSSVQADLLASFRTGAIDHKLLFTVDYNRTTKEGFEARQPTAIATNPLFNVRNLSVDNPNYFFVSYPENSGIYTDIREDRFNSVDNIGLFISERASMLDGRVIALTGVRYDTVKNKIDDRLVGQEIDYSLDEITYQLGINVRLAPGATVYANASTSFEPQARFNIDGTPLPNEGGEGYEAGVKLSLFEEKLNVTAAYFQIERTNLARETTLTEENGSTSRVVILSGREESKGYEIDFNWQLTNSFQLLGAYGNVDAQTLENAEFPFLVGTTPRRTPKHNLGLASRYEFKEGALKGLYFTAGVKYYSRSLVNVGSGRNLNASNSNPIVNRPMSNGLLPFPNLPEGELVRSGRVRVDDGREQIYNDAHTIAEASAGYRWQTSGYRHRVQLNVKNLFDEVYTWGSAQPGDGLTFIGTYSLSF